MEAAIPRAFVFLGEQAAVQCQNLFSARRKPVRALVNGSARSGAALPAAGEKVRV